MMAAVRQSRAEQPKASAGVINRLGSDHCRIERFGSLLGAEVRRLVSADGMSSHQNPVCPRVLPRTAAADGNVTRDVARLRLLSLDGLAAFLELTPQTMLHPGDQH
jgi:hypothetical protein